MITQETENRKVDSTNSGSHDIDCYCKQNRGRLIGPQANYFICSLNWLRIDLYQEASVHCNKVTFNLFLFLQGLFYKHMTKPRSKCSFFISNDFG